MIRNHRAVFNRFFKAGLKLKAKKCTLFVKKVLYLGHVISYKGISTDPAKVKVALNHAMSVKSDRSLVSVVITGTSFLVFLKEQDGHLDLKKRLCKAPVLAMPDFKEFILDTDASNLSIGAVLSQKINDEERPVAYTSQTLTKAERQYCVTRKELLVVVYFAKYSKHYLYGKQFTVRTNHSSSC